MPPKGKSARSRTPSTRQQSKLSFHGSRVTKPSHDAKPTKKEDALLAEVSQLDTNRNVKPDFEPHATAEEAIQRQVKEEAAALDTVPDPLQRADRPTKTEDVLGGRAQTSDLGAIGGKGSGWAGDEELKARKITDTHIKRYWRQKESERLAPRVHQKGLSVYEKILREWDMSGQYGPCIGIARLKRWKRANLLGLQPPLEVLAVLLKELDGGDPNSQRAHVDELMNARLVEALD